MTNRTDSILGGFFEWLGTVNPVNVYWIDTCLTRISRFFWYRWRVKEIKRMLLVPENQRIFADILRKSNVSEEVIKADLVATLANFESVEALVEHMHHLSVTKLASGNSKSKLPVDGICKYFAHSRYIKCTPNPLGACADCKHFEAKDEPTSLNYLH